MESVKVLYLGYSILRFVEDFFYLQHTGGPMSFGVKWLASRQSMDVNWVASNIGFQYGNTDVYLMGSWF